MNNIFRWWTHLGITGFQSLFTVAGVWSDKHWLTVGTVTHIISGSSICLEKHVYFSKVGDEPGF